PPAIASGSLSPTPVDDYASNSEHPSPLTAAGTAAAASSSTELPPSSAAASPRGRGRVPSSPRGRPSSGSPGGQLSPVCPTALSSPSSSCASGSPYRRRGSAGGSSSPRAGGRSNNVSKDRSAIARSLYRSPPPPDLPRSCYYGIGGLSDSGAFWDGGSKPRRSSSSSGHVFPHAAVNILMSRSKEPQAKAEKRDTSPGVSSSSSSPSSTLEQATITTAAAAAAATAATTA
ncbi:unnamed protein product, partial [Laminaria digitata]